jgi:hypothetical protein
MKFQILTCQNYMTLTIAQYDIVGSAKKEEIKQPTVATVGSVGFFFSD